MIGVLAGMCAALAALLAAKPRQRMSAEPAPVIRVEERSALLRFRPVLSVTAAAGTWAFFGGWFGVLVAVVVLGVSWRVLGAVESPAAVRRRERLADELPGAVDLVVAALESGVATVDALDLVGRALPGPVQEELARPVHQLRLGTDPAEVWRELSGHPQLGPLGRSLQRAHSSGASVVLAGRRLADELRRARAAAGEALARSVSTMAAVPMGLCFLPAFLLLGIVPLVGSMLLSFRLG